MAKLREKTMQSREELADLLQNISSQILDGKISFQDIELKVPSNIEIKYKCKQKDGYSKFKLSFKWPDNETFKIEKSSKNDLPVSSYKENKKSLGITLSNINQQLKNGSRPSEEQAQKLIDVNDKAILKSERKLIPGMNEVKESATQLLSEIKTNNDIGIKNAVSALYELKEKYHEQFK